MSDSFTTITLLTSELTTLKNLIHELSVLEDDRMEADLYGWEEIGQTVRDRIETVKEEIVQNTTIIVNLDTGMKKIKQG